jgi:hypothetical protein
MNYTEKQINETKENRLDFYKLLGRYIKKQLTGRFCAYKSSTLLEELREGQLNGDKEIMVICNSYRNITAPLGYEMSRDFFSYGDRYWNNVNRALEVSGLVKVKYGNRWHFEFASRQESVGDGFVVRSK